MTEALKQVPSGPSDAALIAAVRRGDTGAYGVLYERHLSAAKRAAAYLASTATEREDLVAEAFTRVLQTLRAGRGPHEEFRPYLLVTMRHIAINAARRTPSTALFAEVPDSYFGQAEDDPVLARLHGSDAATAFAGLPERWRMVLWHTEIEGESPAAIAPLLGMTPNSVAALAYRAREGLRLAYLRQHLPAAGDGECRATQAKLAGWVRRAVSATQRRKIAAHLDRCPRCREVAAGITQINDELRAVLAPIVLGAAFAAAYLKGSAVVTASGVATVSWLSALKASVTAGVAQAGAAAAIAAVTAVTVVADGPGVHAPGTGTAVSADQPAVHQGSGEITGTDPAGTAPGDPADPDGSGEPAGATEPGAEPVKDKDKEGKEGKEGNAVEPPAPQENPGTPPAAANSQQGTAGEVREQPAQVKQGKGKATQKAPTQGQPALGRGARGEDEG